MKLPHQQKRDRKHDQPEGGPKQHAVDEASAISIGGRFTHSRCRFDLGGR